jgi:hypothetical protein
VAVALIGGGDRAIAFATLPVANPFHAPLDVERRRRRRRGDGRLPG